jgi:hypothetical protein
VAGSCEHGNEHFGSIRGRGFLQYLRDFQLPKDSGLRSSLGRPLYEVFTRSVYGAGSLKITNITMDIREREWEGVDCPHLAQDRDQ